jgi:Transposase
MTVRFIEWVAKEASHKGFVAVAKETSIDRKVARRAFREAEKKLGARVDLLSDTIAIELINLAGRDRPAIIDVRSEFVFDVYASSEDLRKRLASFAEKYSKLHEGALVVLDISLTIAHAGSPANPRDLFGRHVQFVISPPSLEREVVHRIVKACEPLFRDLQHRVGQSLQSARILFCRRFGSMKTIANRRLESWKRIAPDLYSAYLHKEAFLNIWQADARASCEVNLKEWINDVAGQSNWRLKPIVDLVESRSSEILDYGNHRSLDDFHERLGGIVALNKDRTARSFAAARAALRAQGLSHQEAQLGEFLKNVGP